VTAISSSAATLDNDKYRANGLQRTAMGVIELIISVCAVVQADQCREEHLRFMSNMSVRQCDIGAPPHIALWINEHPQWFVARWRCEYPGGREGL
jgi:hypothetical protein